MNRIKTIKLLSAALLSLMLISCNKTASEDYTVNYDNYQTKTVHSFPKELLISEDGNYVSNMENIVTPFIKERTTSGYRDCKSGNKIYYETIKADNSKAVVVFFHGFSEFSEKWNEQTYYFLNKGYDVVRFDHHGHGFSTRSIDNDSKVYTKRFKSYVEDANEIIQNYAVPLANGKPLYCYAHSMGGGIATYYMEVYPDTFKKAALSCPMLGINCGKYGEPLTNFISFVMTTFGKGKNYIPGAKDFEPAADLNNPRTNLSYVMSPERKLYHARLRASSDLYHTTGATYGWTLENVRATKKMRSGKMAKKLKTDILMFQSQNDKLVASKMQNVIRSKTDKITLASFPELEHEMFASKDKYLYQYYEEIFTFFEQ